MNQCETYTLSSHRLELCRFGRLMLADARGTHEWLDGFP